jgi:hypothetical protein
VVPSAFTIVAPPPDTVLDDTVDDNDDTVDLADDTVDEMGDVDEILLVNDVVDELKLSAFGIDDNFPATALLASLNDGVDGNFPATAPFTSSNEGADGNFPATAPFTSSNEGADGISGIAGKAGTDNPNAAPGETLSNDGFKASGDKDGTFNNLPAPLNDGNFGKAGGVISGN